MLVDQRCQRAAGQKVDSVVCVCQLSKEPGDGGAKDLMA